MNPLVVNFGGGVNSTAMLIDMKENRVRPDLIIFADTGGEKPHTYRHIDEVSQWCESVGFPKIVKVMYTAQRAKGYQKGEKVTLERMCLDRKMLPSIAYGYGACSHKHKVVPMDQYIRTWQPAVDAWAKGGVVVKAIGFDAGENTRTRKHFSDDMKYEYTYPLDDKGIDREACVSAICRAGINQPGKSACFFCPNSKPAEIRKLGRDYPDLLERALAIESNAQDFLNTVKGLGRDWTWKECVAQGEMFDLGESDWQVPCACWDGSE
jgi:hypothetical protein